MSMSPCRSIETTWTRALIYVSLSALGCVGCGDDAGIGGGPSDAASSSSRGDGGASSSGMTSAAETTGSGGSGGGGPVSVSCAAGDDLEQAPSPFDAGLGQPAVPIDLETIAATVEIDPVMHVATAKVTVALRMGAADGYPVFDLRQRITHATLDGGEIDPAKMALHDFGAEADGELRIIETPLDACSEHTLELEYLLERPLLSQCFIEPGILWHDTLPRVGWSWVYSDLEAGCYSELWLPSNLIYDRFALSLDLSLTDTTVPHTVVANGEVVSTGAASWSVTFPSSFTALSPMLMLIPTDRVRDDVTSVQLVDDTPIDIRVVQFHEYETDPVALTASIEDDLNAYTTSTGRWPHGDTVTLLMQQLGWGGMEYDGGAMTDEFALHHELYHGWFGRGVKPARAADGWLDEAWALCAASDGVGLSGSPLDPGDPPIMLSSAEPWARTTPVEAYDFGPEVFASLGRAIGRAALNEKMKAFFAANAGKLVTTRDLERHLYCDGRSEEVRKVFHRFIYGRTGEPMADGLCAP